MGDNEHCVIKEQIQKMLIESLDARKNMLDSLLEFSRQSEGRMERVNEMICNLVQVMKIDLDRNAVVDESLKSCMSQNTMLLGTIEHLKRENEELRRNLQDTHTRYESLLSRMLDSSNHIHIKNEQKQL